MASTSSDYRRKIKEQNPEKYEEYRKKWRENAQKKRDEKKRKWLEEPHTPEMIAQREEELRSNRERNRRWNARKSTTKRQTRASSTATPQSKPRAKLSDMTDDERRAHKAAQRREQRARQSHQKTSAHRKKNRERMASIRKAEKEKKLSKLQVALPFASKITKALRNFTSEVKNKISKRIGGDPGAYAGVIKKLATPRTPQKRAAVQTVFNEKKVRRSLKLDLAPTVPPLKKSKSKSSIWRRRMSQAKAKKASLRQRIRSFYVRSEISRILPHKRYATKNGPGYVMLVTIKSAHKMFCDELEQKVSLSLFAKLRPQNVRKLGAVAVETCLCIYCTNIRYKLLSLRRATGFHLPSEAHVLDFVLCPKKQQKWHRLSCINGDCSQCADRLRPFIIVCRDHLDDPITWHRWEREAVADGKSKLDIRFKSGSVMDMLEELSNDLERPVRGVSFFQHLFTAFWQFSQYKALKLSLQPGQVLLVMDFAENRKASYSTEVKSAHFGKGQWTLNPVVAFFRDEALNCVRQHVIMVLSDDITHDYHAVQTYTKISLDDIAGHTKISEVIMWSDGCASQYKGKGSFADLSLTNVAKVQRCYFGSEHGKGEADGATGILSQAMSRAVASGEAFRDAKDLFNWAKKNLERTEGPSTRTFILVKGEEIDRDRPRTEVSTLPGTRSLHQIIRVQDYVLKARKLACFCSGCQEDRLDCCVNSAYVKTFDIFKLKPHHPVDLNQAFLADASLSGACNSNAEDARESDLGQAASENGDSTKSLKVGDFIEVTYVAGKGQQAYYAVVVGQSSAETDMTVSFLRQRGNTYVFPELPEIVAVSLSHDNVSNIKLLKAPIVTARGHHFFN